MKTSIKKKKQKQNKTWKRKITSASIANDDELKARISNSLLVRQSLQEQIQNKEKFKHEPNRNKIDRPAAKTKAGQGLERASERYHCCSRRRVARERERENLRAARSESDRRRRRRYGGGGGTLLIWLG